MPLSRLASTEAQPDCLLLSLQTRSHHQGDVEVSRWRLRSGGGKGRRKELVSQGSSDRNVLDCAGRHLQTGEWERGSGEGVDKY